MSLEGGQFSRSNFWEIFQKINFFKKIKFSRIFIKISCYPPKKIKYFAFV